MKKTLTFFILLLVLSAELLAQVEVSTRLTRALQNASPQEYIRAFVFLREQVDIEALDARLYRENASLERRAYEVITALQEKAASTQPGLRAYFDEQYANRNLFKYESYWIANMFMIEARKEVIYNLMSSMEVAQMDLDAELQIDRPTDVVHNVEGTEAVEPGLKIVNADKLWALGIKGQGRLVMGIDTGVQLAHPALSYKWRGNFVPASQAWFDPGGTTSPNDCDYHGSHTMGTMVGLSPTTGDTVGVAIEAQWIAAKTICSSPHTSNSIAAFQWAMNPDGNAGTITDMPDAISNSWFDPDVSNECAGIYKTTLDALEAAGIAVVFSAGNNGPGTSTITKPKNINTDETNVFSVANIQGALYLQGSNDPIASSSSRGPSVCGGTGSLLIKPEVAAPGTSVRSCNSSGGYTSATGTSMASPHVAGAIALLKSFVPTLTGKQIKLALYNTAKDLGTAGEDNNYGKGLIDVYAAYLTLGQPDTVAPTQITDLAAGQPTSNGLTLTWTVPSDTSPSGVTGYNIRYSTSPMNDTTAFNNGSPLTFNGPPVPAGSTQTLNVSNLTPGTLYYFRMKARDVWGNWSLLSNQSQGTTLAAPVMVVTPDSLSHQLQSSQVVIDSIMIRNLSASASTMNYTVELMNNTFPGGMKVSLQPVKFDLVEPKDPSKSESYNNHGPIGQAIEGQGGPDAFGYKWIDSDEPTGPQYVWNDIASTGVELTNWIATGTFNAKDEGYSGPVNIGFPFKFYGQTKTQLYVSTNGVLLFGVPSGNLYTNPQIPSTTTPNEFIAPFWDDLDGVSSGNVYYKQEPGKLTIQFTNWHKFSNLGSLTFQIVLFANGRIMFYYNNMNATLNSATVGIENGAGNVGLQMAFNANFVKNNFAVKIAADPEWLSTTHFSGTLGQNGTAAVVLEFRSEDYPSGQYSMDVKVSSNDPATPSKIVPVKLLIEGIIPVELTSFTVNSARDQVMLRWATATETNNRGFSVERKSGEGDWARIGFVDGRGTTTEKSEYTYTDKNLTAGTYSYRLKQEDFDGKVTITRAVETEVGLPEEFALFQNYPNPFNPSTMISYQLVNDVKVSLKVYDVLGNQVAELVNSQQPAGYYTVEFDAAKFSLSSGVYYYTLTAGNFNATKKLVITK
ncbi:MAG: S8 family serine peptidase [Ignavibacteriaceae bacterium]|nr:S8 family serine peptidase [Ignavibacteriaceae bacterium]